jgi:hypothetical protein
MQHPGQGGHRPVQAGLLTGKNNESIRRQIESR